MRMWKDEHVNGSVKVGTDENMDTGVKVHSTGSTKVKTCV